MAPEITETTVTAVNTFNTKKGTVYKVKTNDGREFATFKTELGEKAQGLVGQGVKVAYVAQQKGEYLNLYLEGIKALETASAAPQTAQRSADDLGRVMGRNNIAARAAAAIIDASDKTPETIQAILDGLASWTETGEPFLGSAQPEYQPVGGPAQQSLVDEDIPF